MTKEIVNEGFDAESSRSSQRPVHLVTHLDDDVDTKPARARTNDSPKTICGIIPRLLPLKIVIFFIYGGMAALYPFFSLHMKSLHISLKETAVMSLLLPLLSCIGVAAIFSLANKVGHHKWIIIGLSVLHVFCHLLLLGIPGFQIVEVFDQLEVPSVEITFPCHNRESAIFSFKNQKESLLCDARNVTVLANATNRLQIDTCRTDCPLQASHQPSVCFLNATGARGHYCPKWTDLERQILKNLKFKTATPGKFYDGGASFSWETTAFQDDEGSLLRSAHCYAEDQTAGAERPHCSIVCQSTTSFAMLCRTDVVREGSYWLTVVTYFFLRLSGMIGLLSVLAILETVTLQLTREHGGTVGLHRIFAFLALGFFPLISGLLIVGERWRVSDFSWIFVLFGFLNVAAVLLMLFMRMPVGESKPGIWRTIGNVLRSPQVIAVIIIMVVIGMAAGYYTSFLFWFLEEELSMSKYLMGIGTGLGYLLAIPLFFIVNRVVAFVGYANLLVIAVLLNGFRFIAYSYLFDANLFLPVEILTALTIAITYTVVVQFSRTIAPGYEFTMQALLFAVTFGLGAGLGPFFAYYSLHDNGYRISFRIFAILFLIIAIIYLLLHCLILRKTKLPTVEPAEAPPVPVPSKQAGIRNSELFPDETEAMLYKEKASPIAELDELWESSLFSSRPVSGISLHI